MNNPNPVTTGQPVFNLPYDNAFRRKRFQVFTKKQKTRTQQQFAKDVDINTIVSRFEKTGIIKHLNPARPNYGFAPAITLHQAYEQIRYAKETFLSLPSEVRDEFDNDPVKFVEFIEDDANTETLREMGLLPAEEGGAAAGAAPASGEAPGSGENPPQPDPATESEGT